MFSIGVTPARDGLAAEPPAVGVGSDHLVIDEDGAAAHAAHRLGHFEARMVCLDEDQILRRQEILHHVDHLHAEALGCGALEHRQPVSFHATPDLIDRQRIWPRPRARRLSDRHIDGGACQQRTERRSRYIRNASHREMLPGAAPPVT
jgi:hypothetical protein